MKCPNCGADNVEGNSYCVKCGKNLSGGTASQPVTFDPVRDVVVKRFDAIKNKDQNAVTSLMTSDYTKFDDWPPYQRQDRNQALDNEFSAFKVMSNYTYDIRDFKSNALGDSALATFTLNYKATMRNQQFDVTSRVTVVLKRDGASWKIMHEHYSRYPTSNQADQQPSGRRRFPF